jgi:patatin-like phospholipase/acyl hydrolase
MTYKEYLPLLAIDGGGIRGIIPSRILAEIEIRTKRSISDIFKLYGGTSTGSIVISALNIPDDSLFSVGNKKPKFNACDIVKIYTENGTRIFPPSWSPSWLKFLETMTWDCKYSNKSLI